MAKAVKEKQAISMGIDYAGFEQLVDPVSDESRASLSGDIT